MSHRAMTFSGMDANNVLANVKVNVKVNVKLRFSASYAGIAEMAKRLSIPRPLVMTLNGVGGISAPSA